MRNVTIVNNTVIGSMPLRGWGGGSVPTSLSVANNVVYGGSITNQPGAATYSSNLQYGAGTSGIFVDPDNRDFWPVSGSPLIGAADSAHAPTKDFNATNRQSPFDVGAYESDGLTSNPGWTIQDGFKALGDADADGLPDLQDNCPNVQNTAAFPDSEGWNPQQDDDADNIGNACDLVIPPQLVQQAWLGIQNYSHQLVALRCQQTPCTWTMVSGFLPNALTLDSFGVISGAVLAGGFIASFTVEVMDATGDTATQTLSISAIIPRCYNCHTASTF